MPEFPLTLFKTINEFSLAPSKAKMGDYFQVPDDIIKIDF
jgi:hypothetical protein